MICEWQTPIVTRDIPGPIVAGIFMPILSPVAAVSAKITDTAQGTFNFMAKRFTATEKWSDPWFCSLNERDRLFWIYLLDTCNHAGIWTQNNMLLNVYFPDYVFNSETFSERLIKLSPEKWYIPKFVDFQYGKLNPANRAHSSVLTLLEKEGLEAPYMPLTRGLLGAKDKDKDKDKVKVKKGSMRGNMDFIDPYDLMKAQGKVR